MSYLAGVTEKRVMRIQIRSFVFIGCWVAAYCVLGYVIFRQNRLEERMGTLGGAMEERFAVQEARLAEAAEKLEGSIRAGAAETEGRIRNTNYRIQQVNQVYSNLLEEQKKRTLESVYHEDALVALRREAAELFAAGKYKQAYEAYTTIADARPEDMEARFYRYYALFLINRMDAGQYRAVKEGFGLLAKSGYSRKEMEEAVEFIGMEEGAANRGGRE
jgi:tetratricopeptide (TPR) repeat protein